MQITEPVIPLVKVEATTISLMTAGKIFEIPIQEKKNKKKLVKNWVDDEDSDENLSDSTQVESTI